MKLSVYVNGELVPIEVPQFVLDEGGEFFDQLDRDMDSGYQMSRVWVECPDRMQRCQIVADRLLTAIDRGNERIAKMMAGYIMARLPGVSRIDLDTEGDMREHALIVDP